MREPARGGSDDGAGGRFVPFLPATADERAVFAAQGRDPRDFYPTDPRCVEALMRVTRSPDEYSSSLASWAGMIVIDPCCGAGHLLAPFAAAGASVTGADLYEYTLVHPDLDPCVRFGQDILGSRSWAMGTAHLEITNPPFTLAAEVIDKFHNERIAPSQALLLRLSMLGSIARFHMWRRLPAPRLQVLVPRPSFGLNKHGKKGTDNSEYAWFLWGPMFDHLPPVGWLRWR